MNAVIDKTTETEINTLLQAVQKRYGYDFHNYSLPTLTRRIQNLLLNSPFDSISEMIPKLLDDEMFFSELVYKISIVVTEMFRDPLVYQKIRENIHLFNDLDHIKIWCAGCGSGEEAYSLAILLKEEGLYDRCQIYGTDINLEALETARCGVYPISKIKQYSSNYLLSGGTSSLSEYYQAKYDSIILNRALKNNIRFSNHNLVIDGAFGQMNLIICRNVLIYFDSALQKRVLTMFTNTLSAKGLLWLGTKEFINCNKINTQFHPLAKNEKLYQKNIV